VKRYHCIGPVETHQHSFADTPEVAAELFRQEHGVLPATVDGRDVAGSCDGCGVVLFEARHTRATNDGVKPLCGGCAAITAAHALWTGSGGAP